MEFWLQVVGVSVGIGISLISINRLVKHYAIAFNARRLKKISRML